MQLQIKKLNPNAIIPTRNNPTDSGLDLYACLDNDVIIPSLIDECHSTDEAAYNINFINEYVGYKDFITEIETNNPSALIPTGIAIKLPKPESLIVRNGYTNGSSNFVGWDRKIVYEAQIRPRSGLAAKYNISCHLGTIDNEYIGELKVLMYNFSNKPFVVTHGMKIAQLVIQPVFLPDIVLVDELGTTTRGSNGFGSSGI